MIINSRLDPNMLYILLTIFKYLHKGNINIFGKLFEKECLSFVEILHVYLISDIGPCQELGIVNSLRQYPIFCIVFLYFSLKFGFFFFFEHSEDPDNLIFLQYI